MRNRVRVKEGQQAAMDYEAVKEVATAAQLHHWMQILQWRVEGNRERG